MINPNYNIDAMIKDFETGGKVGSYSDLALMYIHQSILESEGFNTCIEFDPISLIEFNDIYVLTVRRIE